MDERIIALFWERSEEAIREAEKAYGRYLHYISYGILKNDEDAKETVNDVYLKAWNVIPPQRPNPLKAFLGRMARQLSINRLEERLHKNGAAGNMPWPLRSWRNVFPILTKKIRRIGSPCKML